ncbi:hypothetical protein BU25DRAFT_140137 [Macroventuria anomochaeta]|uniref:Uncharacterized protein n=1 Tax=Macroventuria anomochaeta TaxID=301207 RepID=A0ACB6SD62_9PLEO|nr:uncharacterized protein BU25DRAFT_140137 [Macroventuria anomochaeta]KAF2632096.1 hypothetical protein BU25DRAFT_140137 [Macroventuria anomochaeta]
MFGEVSQRSGVRVRSKVRLVSRHRRSDGLDGRGMRSEVTARVISSASARYSAQMAVGHRLDSFHAAWSCEGGGRILLLGVAIHRCLPKRHPHLPLARQPRRLRCNWRTTPALGTRDCLSYARSRLTLALSSRAHGNGCDESSAGPAITSQSCWTAGHFTAPNTRQLIA